MKKSKNLIIIAALIFTAFIAFWTYLGIKGLRGDSSEAELYSALYGTMALYGGLIGIAISKRWGGAKSLIGKSVLFISLGLLAQAAGQITYSMYTYIFHVVVPYPSFGDFWYFGSVILYILAMLSLLKALNVKTGIKSHKNKLIVLLVPVALLSFSYYEFLRGYEFDFSNPLVVFLDFGYPFGQAIYVSLALLAYLLARPYLGGLMRPVISLLIIALVIQYVSDFVFLYQVSKDSWVIGGVNELMYLVSYFVMTLSLIMFNSAVNKISGGSKQEEEQEA